MRRKGEGHLPFYPDTLPTLPLPLNLLPPHLLPPQDFLEVRPGFISSMGTFVFAFVSQHTSHGVYNSMAERTVGRWKIVSSVSIAVAGAMTCLVGSFSYFTFWDETSSDLFTIYPPSKVVDSAELLLSVTMLFTYPMPFFTTRELLVEWLVMRWSKSTSSDNEDELGGGEISFPYLFGAE